MQFSAIQFFVWPDVTWAADDVYEPIGENRIPTCAILARLKCPVSQLTVRRTRTGSACPQCNASRGKARKMTRSAKAKLPLSRPVCQTQN
jgi:hypothetical protein